ncbi:MBL fold metallo-hydrolase [Exiguobacterium flavidum]|uniref:MBL fold metallo-hydrolase n=1 Tax=Exiguobacterium flavidum TaxID=2184695 RepID=UPI000DF7D71F|nr:MBL fold metallo-hydrolase [Exiguobacterium flavidum]
MFFRSYFDSKLAQFSYVVGCQRTGEAIVIDPARDVDIYFEIAKSEGLRLTAATETHIHADFVSGARELGGRGVKLYLSDEGDADWKYGYAKDLDVTFVKDGDKFSVGNIRFDVLHTPGHTPEHISFVLTDEGGGSSVPMGIFTGDFVFVGDIGRPDLLEKAAGIKGTSDSGARQLFKSLDKFRALPDYLQVWPGHGAGSACGKSLGAVPMTTVGYEKLNNWALKIESEEEFVDTLLSGQPEPPRYFAVMKRVNKVGPDFVEGAIERLESKEEFEKVREGKVLLDVRPARDYQANYVDGAINIPFNKSFPNWAGWLLPYDQDILLIADEEQTDAVLRAMRSVGLDRVEHVIEPAFLLSFSEHSSYPVVEAAELNEMLGSTDLFLIDVRNQNEWENGHIEGANHIMLGTLESRLDEVPRDKRIVMQCQSGARSAIATSLLKRAGFEHVYNLNGGYNAWKKADMPSVQT